MKSFLGHSANLSHHRPERYSPLMLLSLLESLERFDPAMYRYVLQSFGLEIENVVSIVQTEYLAGSGQLESLIKRIAELQESREILQLAGRNSFDKVKTQESFSRKTPFAAARVRFLASRLEAHFSGGQNFHLIKRGRVFFIEIPDSIFARRAESALPFCSFYEGLFLEGLRYQGWQSASVSEVVCKAVDPEAPCCSFELNIS